MNSSPIIADSSSLISSVYEQDANHQKALKIITKLIKFKQVIIVPCDVISESMNIMGKKLSHQDALILYQTVKNSKNIQICEIDEQIREAASQKFQTQAESVSFVDCIVMAVADSFNTKFIFGFDEVFFKNGYKLPGT